MVSAAELQRLHEQAQNNVVGTSSNSSAAPMSDPFPALSEDPFPARPAQDQNGSLAAALHSGNAKKPAAAQPDL